MYRDHPNEYNKGCLLNSYTLLCAARPRSRLPDLSELVYVDRPGNNPRGRCGSGFLSCIAPARGAARGDHTPLPCTRAERQPKGAAVTGTQQRKDAAASGSSLPQPKDGASTALLAAEEPSPSPSPATARGGAECWHEAGGVGMGREASSGSLDVESRGSTPAQDRGNPGGGGSSPGGGRERNGEACVGSNGDLARRTHAMRVHNSAVNGEQVPGAGVAGLGGAAGRTGRRLSLRDESDLASPLAGLTYANSPHSPRADVDPSDGSGGEAHRQLDGRAMGAREDPRRSSSREHRALPAISPEGPGGASRRNPAMWADGDNGEGHSSGELWYSPTGTSTPVSARLISGGSGSAERGNEKVELAMRAVPARQARGDGERQEGEGDALARRADELAASASDKR